VAAAAIAGQCMDDQRRRARTTFAEVWEASRYMNITSAGLLLDDKRSKK
jgi:hypothetical protein